MTDLPPDEDSSGGVDDRYRRASSREVSRPSEAVRSAVLRHAADLAAQRASAKQPVDIDFKQRAANQAWRRPAAYGGLAAAALVGLLIAPRFFTFSSPPVEDARLGPAVEAPTAAGAPAAGLGAAPAPAAPAEPAAEQRRLQAQGNDQESFRHDRAAHLAAGNGRVPAARTSAPDAAQFGAGDSTLAQDAPPPATAESSPAAAAAAPRAESFTRQATPMPAAPAAMLGGRAAASPPDSASALRQAAALGDLPRLRALLAEQPEIDARDAAGRSALMLAAQYGKTDAVDLLLASGADPNAADSSGATPLQVALTHNRSAIVDALRRAGAR